MQICMHLTIGVSNHWTEIWKLWNSGMENGMEYIVTANSCIWCCSIQVELYMSLGHLSHCRGFWLNESSGCWHISLPWYHDVTVRK